MATKYFDQKTFNGEWFGKYSETIPARNKNELIKSRVMVVDDTLKAMFGAQTGSLFGIKPIHGRIGGDAQNYDGETDIVPTSTGTFKQGFIAFGRMKAWEETDFAIDITSGVKFMDEVAKQVVQYWDGQNTKTLMSIIKGIFNMTGTANEEFVTKHTFDATGIEDGKVSPSTLNTAIQQASGDKKSKFALVFMHSAIATELENQKLLKFLTQTDASGIERPLPLAHWNGKLVVVDDGMPTEQTKDGKTKYTTYVFGEGAIRYCDVGAEVPYEMWRDPFKKGGKDVLITRKRTCYAPYGISFTNASVAKLSPTDAEFEKGENWTLVNNDGTGAEPEAIDHKEIAIARIYTLG